MSKYYEGWGWGRLVFCQVGTSSIKAKLGHRQNEDEGFDCAAPFSPPSDRAGPAAAGVWFSVQRRARAVKAQLLQLQGKSKGIHLLLCYKIVDDSYRTKF